MSFDHNASTTDLLALLNSLRANRNQPELKSWKGSRKALTDTITQYMTKKVEPAVAEGAYDNARIAEHATGLKGTDEKKRQAIAKANTTKNVPATSTKETNMSKSKTSTRHTDKPLPKTGPKYGDEFVSLADIARELKIEPKLARAKARRSDELAKLAQGDAWAFKPADVKKVKAILKPAK